jgi:tape measure domain-containing protein
MATIYATIDSTGARRGASMFQSAVGSISGAARGLTSQLFSLQGALGALGGALTLREFVRAGDAFQNLTSRLSMFAQEGFNARDILDALTTAAGRANAPVGELAEIYNRNAAALNAVGASTAEQVRLSETLYKALVVSGNATESGKQALVQFAQALNSGTFRGEEFNSVNEQATEIIRVLARETGKSAGELRKLAAEGKLTSDLVYKALLNGADELDEKFKQLPQTVSQAGAIFTDTFSRIVGESAQAEGSNRALAEAINEWTKLIASGDFRSLMDWFSGSLKSVADWAGGAAKEIRVMGEESRLAAENMKAQAESEQGFLGWLWSDIKKTHADNMAQTKEWLRGWWTGNSGENAAAVRAQAEANVSWQDGTTVTKEGLDPLNIGGKRELKFGTGTDDADVKRRQKVNDELSKQIQLEQYRAQISQATLSGDTMLAEQLRTQMEIRQRISDEMRRTNPEKAAELEREIELQNQLAIQLENHQELQARNRRFAEDFAGTITGAFESAIRGGQSLSKTLRQVAIDLVNVVAKAAFLDPLSKSLAGGISGMLGGGGFDIAGMLTGATTSGWGATVIPYADGGVVNRPTMFAANGMTGLMGEAGPEAILPLRRGPDGKLGVGAAGGAGGTQVININVAGDATDATVEKMRQLAQTVYIKLAPGTVKDSVAAVANEHRRNSAFLRR